ncbi:MAG: DUF4339 domain-containing protein [Pirellulales bacterium]
MNESPRGPCHTEAALPARHVRAGDRPEFALLKSGTKRAMGIKFSCPNGHKLNVKNFLSGKRAICPKCGARVVVPTIEEAERAAGAPDEMAASAAAGTASTTIEIVIDEASEQGSAAPPPRVEQSRGNRAPATQDAISSAPEAVWYVRPASGGQFGPASGDVMRSWLNDGRVSASSLVWRAGWSDWQTAASVFPQLANDSVVAGTPLATSPAGTMVLPSVHASRGGPAGNSGSLPQGYVVQTIPTVEPATAPHDAGVSALSHTVRRRRRQRDVRLYTSAVLAVISVILMIVLFVVFRRGDPPTKPATTESAPIGGSSIE